MAVSAARAMWTCRSGSDHEVMHPRSQTEPAFGARYRLVPALSASLLLNGVAPFVAYQTLSHLGVPTIRALAATAAFPIAGLALGWVRSRRADGIGLLSLVVIAIGLAGTLLSGDTRLYLLHGSFGSAAFGVVCLASLGVKRPLMFYLGRQLSSGDDRALQSAYDERWASAAVRYRMRVLTLGWGLAYIAEAAARVLLVVALPPSAVMIAAPALEYGVPGLLLLWSMAYAGGEMGCGGSHTRGGDSR
jgi:hypothetical protein